MIELKDIEWLERFLKYKVGWTHEKSDDLMKMYIAGGSEAISIILEHFTSKSYDFILYEKDEELLEKWKYGWDKDE